MMKPNENIGMEGIMTKNGWRQGFNVKSFFSTYILRCFSENLRMKYIAQEVFWFIKIIVVLILLFLIMLLQIITVALTELYYDDGTFEGGVTYNVGEGYAVKFTPLAYPFNLTKIAYYLFNKPNRTFEVHVWDSNGSGGKPGNNLIAPFNTTPSLGISHWHNVTLPSPITINSGDFYAGLIFLYSLEPVIGHDSSDPNNRSYRYTGVIWDLESDKDYGIRALGYYNTTSFKIELRQGWNLISFPLEFIQ